MLSLTRLVTVWVAVQLLEGCAADRDLGRGRFPAQLERLDMTTEQFTDGTPEERARYALLRGLTLLSLGDGVRARPWLSYSLELVTADQTRLTSEERGSLLAAWRSLGLLAGER